VKSLTGGGICFPTAATTSCFCKGIPGKQDISCGVSECSLVPLPLLSMENAETFPQNEDISRREVLLHESCPRSLTSEWITLLFGHHPPPPPKWSYLQNGVQILHHEGFKDSRGFWVAYSQESILWVALQCLVLIRVPRFLRAFHCEWASVSLIPCAYTYPLSFIQFIHSACSQ